MGADVIFVETMVAMSYESLVCVICQTEEDRKVVYEQILVYGMGNSYYDRGHTGRKEKELNMKRSEFFFMICLEGFRV